MSTFREWALIGNARDKTSAMIDVRKPVERSEVMRMRFRAV
jgi:hypothetical protein